MATVNDEILDSIIRHDIHVRKFTAGEIKRLTQLLESLDKDLVAQIRKELAKLLAQAKDPTTSRNLRRLESLLDNIRTERERIISDLKTGVISNATGFVTLESEFAVAVIKENIPFQLDLITISNAKIRSIIREQPFAGHTLGGWFNNLSNSDQSRLTQTISMGYLEGESIDQIVRRVIGTRANGFNDGVLSTTRRDAQSIVRTAVNAWANSAREATWIENDDIVEMIVWVSTLDGRTCFVEGTLVETPGGKVPIETIEEGDLVIGGSGEVRSVTYAKSAKSSDLVDVILSNRSGIRCTSDHPFRLSDGTWREARDLESGWTRLATRTGGATPHDPWVGIIRPVDLVNERDVFDIGVEFDESFLVGGVVVHNSAKCRSRDGQLAPLRNKELPAWVPASRRLYPRTARPPAHVSCRSSTAPVLHPDRIIGERPFVRDTRTRRVREINFRADAKAKAGDDAWRSMSEKDRRDEIRKIRQKWARENIGQMPEKTDYDTFLRRQDAKFQDDVLGPTRGALYRAGKLDVRDFTDRAGEELTLKQLREKFPEAFKRAGI